MGIPYLPWEEILPQCDVISLHMPLLPSTNHFINVSRPAADQGVTGDEQRACAWSKH